MLGRSKGGRMSLKPPWHREAVLGAVVALALRTPEVPGTVLAVIATAEILIPPRYYDEYRWFVLGGIIILAVWFIVASVKARLNSEDQSSARHKEIKGAFSDLIDAAGRPGESLKSRARSLSKAILVHLSSQDAVLSVPWNQFEIATNPAFQFAFDNTTIQEYLSTLAPRVSDMYQELQDAGYGNDEDSGLGSGTVTVARIREIAERLGSIAKTLP